MSELAGRLAIEAAGTALRRHAGGRELLIGGVPGVPATRIVVIGGRVVGTHAAGLGAEVTILERSIRGVERFEGRVRARFSTMDAVEEEVFAADAVIGAVLVPGASAKCVSRDMLSSMGEGSVIVVVAIDQNGCFDTPRQTTHADPT